MFTRGGRERKKERKKEKREREREREREKGASNRLFFVAWTQAVGPLAVWEGFRANYSQRIPPTPQITKL